MKRMRKYLQDLYKVFSADETLLRLLYFLPSNQLDDPLSADKEDILSSTDKWDIIEDRIKFTPTTDGLVDSPICRMFFYPANRGNTSNYLIADQQIKIDIFTHSEYNDVDLRLSWICDHINSLLFGENVTGIGEMEFVRGGELPSPEGYIAYQLVYKIGSSKR